MSDRRAKMFFGGSRRFFLETSLWGRSKEGKSTLFWLLLNLANGRRLMLIIPSQWLGYQTIGTVWVTVIKVSQEFLIALTCETVFLV